MPGPMKFAVSRDGCDWDEFDDEAAAIEHAMGGKEAIVYRAIAMVERKAVVTRLGDPAPKPPPAETLWYPDDEPGWVEWGGGDCPVDPSERVVVLLRLQRLYMVRDTTSGRADMWTWRHTGGAGDIVAYRVVGDNE